MRFLAALVATIVVPAIVVVVAALPFWNEMGLKDPLLIGQIWFECMTNGGTQTGIAEVCEMTQEFVWAGSGAIVTALVGMGLVICVALAALATSWHRAVLSTIFPPLAFTALLVCGLVVLAQAVLLTGGIYLAESYFLGVVHIWLVGVVGLLGLSVAAGVLFSALGMFKRAETHVIGLAVEPVEAPHIYRVVNSLSKKLGIKPPKNIVLGMDSGFFATTARVITPFGKGALRGQTMFLSLPLMRLLSEKETHSIIGHELAHFSGGDTLYSRKFAPVYRGLYNAMHKFEGDDQKGNVMNLPARLILGFILDCFSRAERRISRAREFRADKFGAEVGSAEALSDALLKVSVFSQIWQAEYEDMVGRVRVGRFSRNLSRNFVDRTRHDIDHDKIAGLAVLGLETEVPHPTDSHPTTHARIEALGLNPDLFADVDRLKASLMADNTIIARSDSIERIEEKLTDAYQQIMAHHIGVDESDAVKNESAFSNVLSMLLAKITLADGVVDDREVATAQTEATQYDSAFDPVSFKEYCRCPEDIPELDKLLHWANLMLNPGGAERLKVILHKIAAADGHVDPSEKALLDVIDADLQGTEGEQTSQ